MRGDEKIAGLLEGLPDMPKAPRERVKIAFVSTNSITQGEQVGVLWSELLRLGVKIHFAHRTFSWSNEARGNAAVHCVIVGFALHDTNRRYIFDYEHIKGGAHVIEVKNINPYLVDAPDVVLLKRTTSICSAPHILNHHSPIYTTQLPCRLTYGAPIKRWIKP